MSGIRIAAENGIEVTYAVSGVSFTCTCGAKLALQKRSFHADASGVFCSQCGQHWYINWSEMVLHKKPYEELT